MSVTQCRARMGAYVRMVKTRILAIVMGPDTKEQIAKQVFWNGHLVKQSKISL